MLFSWLGSKTRMRRHVLSVMEPIKREMYVEPFGGACGMIMGKPEEQNEVYNDVNELLVNVFRVIRNPENVATFQRLARVSPQSRSLWNEYKNFALTWMKHDEAETNALKERAGFKGIDSDVLCAFAFFYVQRLGFGGAFMNSYAVERSLPSRKGCARSHRYTYQKVVAGLDAYCERLKYVSIEQKDFAEIFRLYDCEHALFYCDPPYDTEASNTYKTDWGKEKRDALIDLCASCKASVVLSCYDNDAYRELLKAGYEKKTFQAWMSTCKTSYQPRTETVYYRLSEFGKSGRLC